MLHPVKEMPLWLMTAVRDGKVEFNTLNVKLPEAKLLINDGLLTLGVAVACVVLAILNSRTLLPFLER